MWHPTDFSRILQLLPNARIENVYGPTETTIHVSRYIHHVKDNPNIIPIGKPIDNNALYILDERLEPVGIGVIGEIFIGGLGLARGYARSPKLTSEKYIASPFSISFGDRLYRTGDLGRYTKDGNFEFLGRNDSQIKLRGFRIEPFEIEEKIKCYPGVQGSVVLLWRPSETRGYSSYYR